MTMGEAVRSVLGQYATFSGRASRSEYWWWFVVLLLLNIALRFVDGAVMAPLLGYEAFAREAGNPLGVLLALGLLLPNLAVACRRLHDTERSGWWLLIGIIPIIGTLALLVLFALPGSSGENRFGPQTT